MPIFVPIILGAAALGLIAKGVKDGYEGLELMEEADNIVNKAKEEYEREHEKTARMIEEFVNNTLARVGELRMKANELRVSSIQTMSEVIKSLKVRELKTEDAKPILIIDKEVSKELPKLVENLELLKDFVSAGGASALAYLAATGIATKIGVASTGTAIATLSGAAAKNALLAWFGGGSIAAGGGGIALGTAILGGLVVAPVVAIGGFGLKKRGEKALTEAKKIQAELSAGKEKLRIIQNNISYTKEKLKVYEEALTYLMKEVQKLNEKLKNGLKLLSIEENDLKKLFLIVKYGLTPMIEMQIINHKDFSMTNEAEKLIRDMNTLISRIEKGEISIR